MKGKVIQTDDKQSFYVIDELAYNNKKYIFCTECDPINKTLSTNLSVKECYLDQDDNVRVKTIEDLNEETSIAGIFLQRYQQSKNN